MGLLDRWRARDERHDDVRARADFLEQVTAAFDGAPGVTGLDPRPDGFVLVVRRADGEVEVPLEEAFAASRDDSDGQRADRVARLVASYAGGSAAAGPPASTTATPPPAGPRADPPAPRPGPAAQPPATPGSAPPPTGGGPSARPDGPAAGAAPAVAHRGGPSSTGPPGSAADRSSALPLLRPVLRGEAALGTGDDPAHRPAGRPTPLPYVAELLVLETSPPRGTSGPAPATPLVDWAQLAAWDVGLDEAFTAAWQRLAGTEVEVVERRAPDGRLLLEHRPDGGRTGTRLLQPGWLRRLETRCGTRLVAVAPTADELWAVPADDVVGLDWLVDTAREAYLASTDRLSPVLVSTDDGGAVGAWLPPDDDPLTGRVRAAHRLVAADQYATQRAARSTAPLELVELPGAGLLTRTTWRRDTADPLPDSDLLELVPDPAVPESAFLVSTTEAAVAEALERWTQPVAGAHPPLRAATGYPDSAVLEALRARAYRL